MKIGVCYRPHIHNQFLDLLVKNVNFLEIMPEITDIKDMKHIKELSGLNNIDLGLHCLRTSIFSPEGPQEDMLDKYFYVSEFLNSKYFSDYIAYSYIDNVYLTAVQQIEYNDRSLEIFQNNLPTIAEYFPENFLIENITQTELTNDQYTESEFIDKVIQSTNVSLMLDITNMYITCKRNNKDFKQYVESYPFDKVKVMHVSGLTIDERGVYQDTHFNNLDDEILEAVKYVKPFLTNLEYVLVERDFNVNSAEDILNDVNALKDIFASSIFK
ncbi:MULTISPECIES: DUF692 family multinuclear iron-containing protein [unclassified Streptococcus]|uniref:multinuclear nonheme iron-dependent oxidase n=1 Tax=unclassified Streptococcus TaxID=2608887 RepID=UPI0018CB0B21|nr:MULTISPECIES: DUF692 family multinuclear iron-containing protein [unclassified Streptococcus]MBG9366841.1 DUF692 family protein [Streptococcus sp. NLN64]MBJ6746498.1 DUF692 family protein [Streptococcus sp. 121]